MRRLGTAMSLVAGRSARRRRSRRPLAVAAEMDHGRPKLSQLAQEIHRLDRPSGDELELVSVSAALELDMNRPRLAIEGQRTTAHRIRGQEQDGVLCHRSLDLRAAG